MLIGPFGNMYAQSLIMTACNKRGVWHVAHSLLGSQVQRGQLLRASWHAHLCCEVWKTERAMFPVGVGEQENPDFPTGK